MKEPENFDFTVVITDDEERCRSGSEGSAPAPRLATRVKLIALWNLLFGLVVGVPFVLLMSWVGDDCGSGAVVICALLFACAHTTASAVSFKRYRLKYNAFVWQFVLLCVMPLLVLGAVSYITAWAVGGWDSIFFAIFALSCGGYSVVYGVLLFAVLGIMHAVKNKAAENGRTNN